MLLGLSSGVKGDLQFPLCAGRRSRAGRLRSDGASRGSDARKHGNPDRVIPGRLRVLVPKDADVGLTRLRQSTDGHGVRACALGGLPI